VKIGSCEESFPGVTPIYLIASYANTGRCEIQNLPHLPSKPSASSEEATRFSEEAFRFAEEAFRFAEEVAPQTQFGKTFPKNGVIFLRRVP